MRLQQRLTERNTTLSAISSVREAQQAGRRYAEDLVHNSMAGGRLSLKQQPLAA